MSSPSIKVHPPPQSSSAGPSSGPLPTPGHEGHHAGQGSFHKVVPPLPVSREQVEIRRSLTPRRSRSPRREEEEDMKKKFNLPKMWEPKFPPRERLMSLVTDNGVSPVLRAQIPEYRKTQLSPKSRAINGWRNATDGSVSTERSKLISDILSRWWYVFPQWPPPDFDYSRALRKQGLREVPIPEFLNAPEIDPQTQLKKVYQLGNFRGLFRDSNNHMHDMRPKDSCPSYVNLAKRPWQELCQFAVRAVENQMIALKQEKGAKWEKVYADLQEKLKVYRGYLSGQNKKSGALQLSKDDVAKRLRKA
ncbi:unnamed protein product [Amoebophrya sp. A120]|nr:unnamed protein product [Amoebophrya sp. A120]|eukprot:GSA120T00019495001.1